MYRDHSVGVVVPAYNESGHVGDVLRSVPDFVDRIYVVDDCSTDDTWAKVTDVADGTTKSADGPDTNGTDASDPTDGEPATGRLTNGGEVEVVAAEPRNEPAGVDSSPAGESEHRTIVADQWTVLLRARTSDVLPEGRIVPIRHDVNRGAGGAIKTGYLAALADGIDIVATIDGDGQMDPGRLPRYLDPIVRGDADYTKGNRFAAKGSLLEMPTVRVVGNVMLTVLTRIASGYWSVSDPQNGYTAISADALAMVDVPNLFEYYGYCNEMLVRLGVAGATVRDVPAPARYGDEESHIDLGTYVPKVSMMLLRNFLWRLALTHLQPDRTPDDASDEVNQTIQPIERDGVRDKRSENGAQAEEGQSPPKNVN